MLPDVAIYDRYWSFILPNLFVFVLWGRKIRRMIKLNLPNERYSVFMGRNKLINRLLFLPLGI